MKAKNLNNGKIYIPTEIRKELSIDSTTELDVSVNDQQIIISKLNPVCRLCGGDNELQTIQNVTICKECLHKISKAYLNSKYGKPKIQTDSLYGEFKSK